ncbi:MAG: M23 family metallopeptidase [Deltaproteobacteria bacterium]|nr:MAG: M23 family metallopeptidase [Deltaproteobacteria bacterium]
MSGPTPPIRFSEATGIRPLRLRLHQALVALRGEEGVPPSRFDRTSLSQLKPRISLPLWRGHEPVPRTVLITNLFNHTQTPIAEGWSVRRTQMRDFRGRSLTYDSHNGTDFAIPVGTAVLTAAAGTVVRVASEFNRGGLKVFIDHGQGMMTCYAHLARTHVEPGQRVERGERIAWSGYSGLDGFATFPWGVPHVHFNVWLNGAPVDPFPFDDAPSLWRAGDRPTPPPADGQPEPFPEPSAYDPQAVDRAIEACVVASAREELRRTAPLWRRAAAVIATMNYYPTRFSERVCVYADQASRTPRLDLPFEADRFDRAALLDEL